MQVQEQTKVKERPILFSGEMVQAILAGRKTMTRRVVKFPKHSYQPDVAWIRSVYQDGGGNWVAWSCDHQGLDEFTKKQYPNGEGFPCPYGKPGERLWVRETWALQIPVGASIHAKRVPHYRADEGTQAPRWRPSIHMPRWASRLTLEVVSVKVERVQDITRADCVAEGIFPHTFAMGCLSDNPPDPRWKFIELWDDVNGAGSWDLNPWVWCVSFKRVED